MIDHHVFYQLFSDFKKKKGAIYKWELVDQDGNILKTFDNSDPDILPGNFPTTEDEKERSFLKKLQGVLPTVTTGIGLVKSVIDLAAQMGLDPHQISKLFS